MAYDAKIAGFQIGNTLTVNSNINFDVDFAALFKMPQFDVANNSWGFSGNFERFATSTPPIADTFFRPAVQVGRGGLGR